MIGCGFGRTFFEGVTMKILFVRHGEPDYVHDSLTARGDREAELLADMLCRVDADAWYCSPLGRAVRTASFTMKRLGKEAEILPWLQEFRGRCVKPNIPGKESICWDWLPQDWTRQKLFYDRDRWLDAPEFDGTNVRAEHEMVVAGLDALLARHGYERDGELYRAVGPNNGTIVLFCHFAVTSVMLGHLLGISPLVLFQGLMAAPTSVTTVVTEERKQGIAAFRMLSFGSVQHLYAAGENPSFAGRFCECFSNTDELH